MLDILLKVVPILVEDKDLVLTESKVIKKLYNFALLAFSFLHLFLSLLYLK